MKRSARPSPRRVKEQAKILHNIYYMQFSIGIMGPQPLDPDRFNSFKYFVNDSMLITLMS